MVCVIFESDTIFICKVFVSNHIQCLTEKVQRVKEAQLHNWRCNQLKLNNLQLNNCCSH